MTDLPGLAPGHDPPLGGLCVSGPISSETSTSVAPRADHPHAVQRYRMLWSSRYDPQNVCGFGTYLRGCGPLVNPGIPARGAALAAIMPPKRRRDTGSPALGALDAGPANQRDRFAVDARKRIAERIKELLG